MSATAKVVGIISIALVVCFCPNLARADGSSAELVFPGWRVATSEDAWANEELTRGIKRYPIWYLLDGNLSTAWVFEGPKWEGEESGHWYRPATGTTFLGGVGQWIQLSSSRPEPALVDAVGIVNGYAKSPATYERNNRVTRVHIETGLPWAPRLLKTVDLEPVMWMQIIAIPETVAEPIRIRVDRVEQGSDNDLCISELQLYHRGRAVIPRPPPYLLYSPGDECGCGHSMHLMGPDGRMVYDEGILAECLWCLHRFSDNGRLVALSSSGEGGLAVADLRSGKRLYETTKLSDVSDITWTSDTTLRITTRPDDAPADFHYELDLMEPQAGLSRVSH